MKRRFALLALSLSVALMVASCHKNCRCYLYDGTTKDYSKDEVENHGGSCSDMVYVFGDGYYTKYYSLCEWD